MNVRRVAELVAPRSIVLQSSTFSPDHVEPGYVRLRVVACGICGTDLSMFTGLRMVSTPRSLGHEYFGEVVGLGSGVSAFRLGDYVAVDPNVRCGYCTYCHSGQDQFCVDSDFEPYSNRGLATHVDIEQRMCCRISSSNLSNRMCLVEPLSCALHAIRNMASVSTATERVAVIGGGSLGLLTVAALLLEQPQVSVEVFELSSARRLCLEKTFGDRIRVFRAPVVSRSVAYDSVVETSGTSDGLATAITVLRRRGHCEVISRLTELPAALLEDMVRTEKSVRFSNRSSRIDFVDALALLESSLNFWNDVERHSVTCTDLDRLDETLKSFVDRSRPKVICVISQL